MTPSYVHYALIKKKKDVTLFSVLFKSSINFGQGFQEIIANMLVIVIGILANSIPMGIDNNIFVLISSEVVKRSDQAHFRFMADSCNHVESCMSNYGFQSQSFDGWEKGIKEQFYEL